MAMYVNPVARTLSQSVIDWFAEYAGPENTWDNGLKGGSEPSSKFKALIRMDLAERQGFVCPQCSQQFTREDVINLEVEACHIVSQGAKDVSKGWLPGNVFVGHGTCNKRTAAVYDFEGKVIKGVANLSIYMLKAPSLVAMEWTPLPVLKRTAGYLK